MRETRDALLDGGEKLIAAHGLDLPSLDAICEAAGFTRGAFYVHFADREAFLDAVMERAGARVLDRILGGDEPLDLATTAHRFLRAVDDGEYPLTKKGGLRPHQLLEACARSPAVRRRYVALVQESMARLSVSIDRGMRDESVRRDVDARSLSTLLLALVIGAQTLMELEVPIDLARIAATTLRLASDSKRKNKHKR